MEWEQNLMTIAPQYTSVIMRTSVLNVVVGLVCQQHHCKLIHLSYLPIYLSILPSMTAIFWLVNLISNHQNLISLDFASTFHIWHNRKTDQLRTSGVHIPQEKSESHASNFEMMMSQHDLWKIMLWHSCDMFDQSMPNLMRVNM